MSSIPIMIKKKINLNRWKNVRNYVYYFMR